MERAVMTLAAHAAHLEDQLERLERRMEDMEDAVQVALDPAGLDALAARLDELSMTAVTSEELLDVRLHSARVATELDRMGNELRGQIDRAAAMAESDHVSWRATA
jgi:hypothetical protein